MKFLLIDTNDENKNNNTNNSKLIKYLKNTDIDLIVTDSTKFNEELASPFTDVDYIIQPFNSENIQNQIDQILLANNEKNFENYKMMIKGKLLNKLEHQWKQPLNFISTNLLNLEIKSELDKLEHSDIEKINKNIETSVLNISNNISLLNRYFQNSPSKTIFSINSVIEKNLDILFYRMTQNNIQLHKDSKNLDHEISNYESEFVLLSMLFLYILVEWTIRKKVKNDKLTISLRCEIIDGDINLCISINKYFSFDSMIEYYDIEFFLIKNLLKKTSMKYISNDTISNTFFQITINKENIL